MFMLERRGEEERVNAPVIHSVDPGLTDQQTGLVELELELLCQGWSFTSCLPGWALHFPPVLTVSSSEIRILDLFCWRLLSIYLFYLKC